MTRLQRLRSLLGRYPSRRERMCVGKQGYPHTYAEHEAARLRKLHQQPDIHAYECPQCAMWHTGRKGTR